MDAHQFSTSSLAATSSALTDVLQQIAVLQSCPTSCIPSTSTATMLSPTFTFPTVSNIPSVNVYAPPDNQLAIQIDPVQSLLSNPSLLHASPSAVEALANALFATTSRRASCPEPPATSQATTLQIPSTIASSERRRYSETNLDVLIREQLAQLMPSTSQIPGMPGCYYQHVPSGIQGGITTSSCLAGAANGGNRRVGHRKAR
uniref:Uncharacterized protein n=1 Tax=Caenorhabditis japonica TaxID=281687 RepID=A0A8R1IL07_CAEJA